MQELESKLIRIHVERNRSENYENYESFYF